LADGKFDSANPQKSQFTIALSDGKKRTFSLDKEAAYPLAANFQWADVNKLKQGDPIEVVYQDETNLPREAINRYWIGQTQNHEGREAFRKMLERQMSGKIGAADTD